MARYLSVHSYGIGNVRNQYRCLCV